MMKTPDTPRHAPVARSTRLGAVAAVSALALLLGGAVWADGGGELGEGHERRESRESREGRSDNRMPAVVPKAYVSECASCHVGYPPGMLPKASWARMMGGLDKHYGSDASLDAATVAQLNTWLQANAGTYKRVREEPPEDRITRTAWFTHKHEDIAKAVWKLPSVKSAANCAACHDGADKGIFSEDKLKEPEGLSWWQRRAFRD